MVNRIANPLIAILFLFTLVGGGTACGDVQRSSNVNADQTVQVGAKVLLNQHLDSLRKHRVGLVMNPTARVDGVHMLDTLMSLEVPVTALFAPEHGFRGRAAAGERIRDGVDQQTGLPVYSLYGETRTPTPRMLEKVDLLVFDIQDVGARFYTYHVTMGNVIEAAARSDIPIWILDRPNPAGGNYVSGWLLRDRYKSFVGQYPIPVVHGMTMGELARMIVGEGWIEHAEKAKVKVIPMKHWKRDLHWGETGLEWYPPSPNLPRFENAYFYLGTAFFEGTTLSEGRGTDQPFLNVGAPGTVLPDSVIAGLEKRFPVQVERHAFIPRSIPGTAPRPKYEGEEIRGVKLTLEDGKTEQLDPLVFGLRLMKSIYRYTPDVQLKDHLYRLAGTDEIRIYLNSGDSSSPESYWKEEVESFRERRKAYLLYP